MLPTPNKPPQTEEETLPQEAGIDMVGIYRTILGSGEDYGYTKSMR